MAFRDRERQDRLAALAEQNTGSSLADLEQVDALEPMAVLEPETIRDENRAGFWDDTIKLIREALAQDFKELRDGQAQIKDNIEANMESQNKRFDSIDEALRNLRQ